MWFTDFGVEGVMWVWTVAVSLQSLSILIYVCRLLGAPSYKLVLPIIYGYVICAVLSGAFYLLGENMTVESTWIFIIPFFIILFVIYVPIMFKVLMRSGDRQMLSMALPEAVVRHMPGFLLR